MATTKVINDERVWHVLGRILFPVGIPPDENFGPAVTVFPGGYPTAYIDPMTLEWDHDFTPAEEEAWTRLIRRCRRMARDESDTDDAKVDAAIVTLKAWKNRTQTATDAQRDAVLDAMVSLWAVELRDDGA